MIACVVDIHVFARGPLLTVRSEEAVEQRSIAVVPFEARDGKWKLFPTVIVDKIIPIIGVFPLRGSPIKEMSEMRCDKAWNSLYKTHERTELAHAEDLTVTPQVAVIETSKAEGAAEVSDIVG